MTPMKPFQTIPLVLAAMLATTASAQTNPALLWAKASGPWGTEFDGSFGAIAVHPTNPNVIFVGSSALGPGVFKSSDGGATWSTKNSGIAQIGLFTSHYPPISKIVISPSNPNVMYLGTAVDDPLFVGGSGDVYRSSDAGETWQKVDGQRNLFGVYQIEGAISDLDVHPQKPEIVYAGVAGQGVLKTSNGGLDWNTVFAAGSALGTVDYFHIVRILPTQPSTVFFSGFTYYSEDVIPGPPIQGGFKTTGTQGLVPFALRKSTDEGATWRSIPDPSPIALFTDLQFEKASGNLYLSTIAYQTPVFFHVGNRGVFKSSNSGENWQAINQATFASLDQLPFVALAVNPSSVNAGIFASGGLSTMFIGTTDQGNHWLNLDPCLLNACIGRGALAGNKLFLLTSVGIYSADVSVLFASSAPVITKVEPAQLQPLPSPQTQTLHIYGSGFTSSSTLVFTHGASVFNSVQARLHFQNANQIDYDIIVDGAEGDWWVKVVNGSQESNLGYFTVTPMPTVARPTISPFGGSSTGPVQVTLGCDTVGAQIHYSLNGNDPTTSDTAYTGPFTLTSSATVKARAFLTGYNPSPVTAASFTVATMPGTVAITIATAPPGLLVSVDDGAATPAPVTVNRTPGQTLNVNSPSPQVSSDGHTRYNFASWSDGGTQAHTVITPSADRTYTATFAPQYQLAITVSPPGSGNVTATPSAAWYNPGQPVSLVAQAASGNSFSSWSGVDSQSGDAAQVTMNGYRDVTASFFTRPSGAGSIRVSIVPQAAADQGAQWKLTSESQWHSSGAIITVSSLGDYVVQFKTISGWTTPPNKTISLFPAQTYVWIDSDLYLQQGPGDAPTVTTLAANSISAFTGTMNGSADGNGWATAGWFEWSIDPTLATYTATPGQAIGPNAMPVGATLIQLVPNTPYYYRIAASNSQGTVRGAILSFTTLAQTPSSIVTWGDSSDGQRNVPAGLSDIVAIAAGGFHALALSGEGTVSAWGLGFDGQTSVPTDLQNVVAVSAGLRHSVALRADGTVAVWGGNDLGQRNVPAGLNGVVAIAASSYHTLALKNDGTVAGWGGNDSGQSSPPPGLSGVIAIAAGDFHSLALKRDGTIIGWGSNADGELDIPAGLDDVVAIAAGVGYSLALRNDGTAVAWGFNGYGETSIPPGLNDVVSIAAGAYHCLALKRDGTVVAWGRDVSGQIDAPSSLPTIGGISAGNSFSMALANAGPPVIIQQPQSATMSPGGTVLFKVSAVGAVPLTYQWRLNGTDLPGETSSTLLLSSAKVTDSGSYSVAVTGPAGTRMSAAALLQVTASPFTVLWANPPDITYGAALSPAQLNATASIPGSFAYDPPAGAVLPAGNAQLLTATFTPSDTTTYQSTTATATINVLKATLAVAASDSSRPYRTPNPDFGGAIAGIQNGDNITATYACSATPGSPAGTYSILPTVHDPDGKLGNYVLSTAIGTLTVIPAALVVSANDASRTYGGANPALTGMVTSVQNGDNITASYSCIASSSSPVGQYAIVPTLYDPDGKLSNYSVTLNNAALTVSPASLTVTADNKNRAYGASNPAFTGIVNGVQNGDNITAAFNCSATPTSPVGTYPIVPSLNDPGGSLGNYNVTLNNGILTVAQAPATVTLNLATLTQVYDGFPNVVVADTTPSGLAVTFTYSGNLTPPTAAGNYAVIATVNDANYTGSATGTLVVSPIALTVTGIAAANKPYDGKTTATITGTPALVGVIGGDAVTIAGTPAGTFKNKNVGNNKPVTVTGLSWGDADAGNYTLSVPTLSASITPAPLVVSADNKTRAFGTANPPFTGTIIGLQAGDSITATYNCSATITSPAGPYPIVPLLVDPANDLANYNVTLNNGTLTIMSLELKLGELAFDTRHFGLSIATEVGLKYTLEYTVSLTAPVWAPVKTVTGNGSVLPLDDANASDAARFYRVRVEPEGP